MDEAQKDCMGDVIRELRDKHPDMARDQQIAIALSKCGQAKAEYDALDDAAKSELDALYDGIVESAVKAATTFAEAAEQVIIGEQPDAAKAGRVLSGANADAIGQAVQSLIDVLARAGIDLLGLDPKAPQDMGASSEPAADPIATRKSAATQLDDLLVYPYRTAIKSLGNHRYGMHSPLWGDSSSKDLDGEYFDRETDFALDWYDRRPLLYQHGLDGNLQTIKIGTIYKSIPDETGLWNEFELDYKPLDGVVDQWKRQQFALHNDYLRAIEDIMPEVLGGSIAATPQHVVVEANGHIKRWCYIENTLTPTAADPRQYQSRIQPLKTYLAALTTPVEAVAPVIEASPGTGTPEEPTAAAPTMTQAARKSSYRAVRTWSKAQMDAASIIAAGESAGLSSDQILAMLKELGMNAPTQPEEPAAPELPADGGMSSIVPDGKSADIQALIAQGVKDALKERFGEPELQSAVPQNAGNGANGIAGKNVNFNRDLELHPALDDLSAADMVMALMVEKTVNAYKGISSPFEQRAELSPRFAKSAAFAVAREIESGNKTYNNRALKSAMPFYRGKSDEIIATNLSSYGQSWVGVAYENMIWEAARVTPIWQQLVARNMMDLQVRKGVNEIDIPSEGTDPTWYTMVELNDLTSDEFMPVTPKVSTPTAPKRQLTVGNLAARVVYTDFEDEDALIELAPWYRSRMEISAQEAIEYALINGDTETSTTNINYDGSAVSGLADSKGRLPRWAAFNGFLKLPIVTTTTLSRDATGALSEDDYLNTLALMPAAEWADLSRVLFIVDTYTYLATAGLPSLKTRDVSSYATIENGRFTRMYGADVLMSGQMPRADTDGKVTYNGNVTNRGRILAIRPDQWVIGRKRDVRTEMQRDIDAQSTSIVSTLRLGIQSRSANGGAAVSYNVAI